MCFLSIFNPRARPVAVDVTDGNEGGEDTVTLSHPIWKHLDIGPETLELYLICHDY